MTGSLFYGFTASLVLLGYGLVNLPGLLPPAVTAKVGPAALGAVVLLIAAAVNFWKPRIASIVALAGLIFIWPVLLSSLTLGAVALSFFYFIFLIPLIILFVTTVVLLTTVYAAIVATGVDRGMGLPTWLFPPSPPLVIRLRLSKPGEWPLSVRAGLVLLYTWFTLNVTSTFHHLWVNGSSQFRESSFWMDVILLLASAWMVMQVTQGKNWARIVLLLYFFLGVSSFLAVLRAPSNHTLEIAAALIGYMNFAIALMLLFSSASAAYFKHS